MVALGFTSCDDSSEGLTRITYYPVIELEGDAVAINLGEDYVEPGYTATLNGEDISSTVVTSNDIDNTTLGVYSVNYSAVNADGFYANESRDVYVIDEGKVATVYMAESQYGTRHYYNNPIVINDNGDGTYTIEDILGGFYALGRYPGYEAYGYDFWAEAVITVHPEDRAVELVSVGSWYFGRYTIEIGESDYDPETGVITLDLDFAGDPFYVQLVPVTK